MEEHFSVSPRSEHCEHYTGRGVMKLQESGTTLALNMRVPVSKMCESIEALIQASLKTAKDPDGGPYPVYPSSQSWDGVLGKMSSGKKFHRNVGISSEQQLVDSDTVDPGWDGELMDIAFVFAKKRTPCARRPVTATPQQRGLARLQSQRRTRSGKCHGIQGRVH